MEENSSAAFYLLTCSNAYRHIDTHVHTHSYTCTQTRTCTCLHRDTHVCACTCMDAHETHVHMCTDTYVHAHTYTYKFRGNSWLPTTDLKTQLQETIKFYLYISVFSFQIQTAQQEPLRALTSLLTNIHGGFTLLKLSHRGQRRCERLGAGTGLKQACGRPSSLA